VCTDTLVHYEHGGQDDSLVPHHHADVPLCLSISLCVSPYLSTSNK